MNLQIENYWNILLLLLLPLVGVLFWHYLKWRKTAKETFAEKRFQEQFFPKRDRVKVVTRLYFLAFSFLIMAMLDFISNETTKIETNTKTSNVLFLLDVSNSMNAEDVEPSRLILGKNIIINSLKEINAKVGIVVFAGQARSIMPLTTDISSAEMYVDAIETSMIKVQGTDFLAAMKVAVEKFKNIPKGKRTIVLISDGEDNEENDDKATELAKSEGISVIAVGVGTKDGAPIPDYYLGQLMGYKQDFFGEIVISKRQDNALKNLSESTSGAYIDGNDMEKALPQIVEKISEQASSSMAVTSQNAKRYYQYFLAIALALFFVIYFIKNKD